MLKVILLIMMKRMWILNLNQKKMMKSLWSMEGVVLLVLATLMMRLKKILMLIIMILNGKSI